MTDRHTVDTITSDQLDALQLRAARMEHATKQAAELAVRLEDAEATAEQHARNTETVARERETYRQAWKEAQRMRAKAEQRTKQAEAAIARVRKLASRWAVLRAYGGAATELRAALDEPKVDDSSPAAPIVDRPFRSHRKPANPTAAEPVCGCTYGDRCPNCRD
ncbi:MULTISPECIES: hypothetical protein [unclassified Streptomyces]|uniref:hypothetical protein n=1 Tax=unclassified Streptomyces TaxID=2593676 RepID=UPI001488EFD9|nr:MULTISPECIES: hypothetical protein [unclassified Streptomyces]